MQAKNREIKIRNRSFENVSQFKYLYSSPSIIRNKVEEDELGGTCGTNGREDERV
jgi:hypothetical protein